MSSVEWMGTQRIPAQAYKCAYCSREVAADVGWSGTVLDRTDPGHRKLAFVARCPRCTLPTFIVPGSGQVPPPSGGEDVGDLPDDVGKLYAEARAAVGRAPSGAVLLGRKVLMHVAVEQGAEAGASFKRYVDFLDEQKIVGEGMKAWINEIREMGNDANHEIITTSDADAEELLTFVAMLLRVVYEYPAKAQRQVQARASRSGGM